MITINNVLYDLQMHFWKIIMILSSFYYLIKPIYPLIGYDCGSQSLNITTLSLLEVGECDIPQQNVQAIKTYIQLLQINEFNSIRVIQCKIEIDRLVRKCGMFSHTSDVLNGKYAYLEEVSRDACEQMYQYGTIKIASTIISGLKNNQTNTRPITFAGSVDNDGKCAGTAYSDPYGSWTEVIVTGTVKISLRDYMAVVNINTNRIHLKSGVACELTSTNCIDIEGGYSFWDPIPGDSCKFSTYGVLYEGTADKLIDEIAERPQIVYSLTTEDITFALTKRDEFKVCGYTLIRTEHPKLLIFETRLGETFIPKGKLNVNNLDIFAYINSKFIYVERHIRSQINLLYHDILKQRCTLEQQMMKNALAIATQSPDIFAFNLMKGPGYMALMAGEVVHIAKCIPVEVRIINTVECYTELPVLKNNHTYFLTPRTHILTKAGTQISCNSLVPPMYLLEGAWYKLIPKPIESLAPTIMQPLTKPTWKYTSPGTLAISGIYSASDLDELRDHIMFPAERPAILNTMARGVMGQSVNNQGGSISHLLDEKSIEKIAASAWDSIWSKFLTFGNISAGLMGLIFIFRLIKLIVDTIIHGYALHTIYGWSIYLLGALWDSVTHLLLHLNKNVKLSNHNQPAATESQSTCKTDTSTNDNLSAPDGTLYPTLSNTENQPSPQESAHFFVLKP